MSDTLEVPIRFIHLQVGNIPEEEFIIVPNFDSSGVIIFIVSNWFKHSYKFIVYLQLRIQSVPIIIKL